MMNRSPLSRLFLLLVLLVFLAVPAGAQEHMITAGFQLPFPLPSVGYSRLLSDHVAVGGGLHLIPLDESVLTGAYGEIRFIPSGGGFDAFYLSGSFSWVPGKDASTHLIGSVLAGWQWLLSEDVGVGLAGGLGAWHDSRWRERDPRVMFGRKEVVPLPIARFEIAVVL
jgi:hypothetical protein